MSDRNQRKYKEKDLEEGGGLNQGKTYKGNRRLSSAHLRSFLTRRDSLSRIFANYYYWCGVKSDPTFIFS